ADFLRQGPESRAGGDAGNEEAAGPEREDARFHEAVEAVNYGGDDDHAGDADDDAENGEGGTRLAGADRIEGDVEIFADVHGYSVRNATTGSSLAAFTAGYRPKKSPMIELNTTPRVATHVCTAAGN